MTPPYRAFIFDLDGTLADTGPDLVAALNALRLRRQLAPVAYERVQPLVSHGSRRMMQDFLLKEGEDVEAMRDEFLAEYAKINHATTVLFDGIDATLRELERRAIPWAIVTNKPTALTLPLLPVIGLKGRARAIVCSDTLPRYKPEPDGLLHVAGELKLAPQSCAYVGDNEIDVAAAAAAKMPFVAAGWGYWPAGQPAAQLLATPAQLLELAA